MGFSAGYLGFLDRQARLIISLIISSRRKILHTRHTQDCFFQLLQRHTQDSSIAYILHILHDIDSDIHALPLLPKASDALATVCGNRAEGQNRSELCGGGRGGARERVRMDIHVHITRYTRTYYTIVNASCAERKDVRACLYTCLLPCLRSASQILWYTSHMFSCTLRTPSIAVRSSISVARCTSPPLDVAGMNFLKTVFRKGGFGILLPLIPRLVVFVCVRVPPFPHSNIPSALGVLFDPTPPLLVLKLINNNNNNYLLNYNLYNNISIIYILTNIISLNLTKPSLN